MFSFAHFRPLQGALFALTLVVGTSASYAAEKGPAVPADMNPKDLISPVFVGELRNILKHEIVQMMVGAQNDRHAEIKQDEIIRLDKKWRAERKANDKPLISATISNPL